MKNENLIKKIEMFEKLAVFGDRKTFLQAIANDFVLTPLLKDELNKLVDILYYLGEDDALTLSNSLRNSLTNTNPNVLLNDLETAKVYLEDKNPKYYQKADLLAEKVTQLLNTPAPSSYKNIDPYIQKALHYLGAPGELKTDGILGPQTRAALDWFKEKNNLSSDSEAFETAKKLFKQKYPGMQFSINDPNYNENSTDVIKFDPNFGARPVEGPK